MNSILEFTGPEGNDVLKIFLLAMAFFRIYLEVIGFSFEGLPLTKRLMGEKGKSFHRMGLYFGIGYILATAPGILLS